VGLVCGEDHHLGSVLLEGKQNFFQVCQVAGEGAPCLFEERVDYDES